MQRFGSKSEHKAMVGVLERCYGWEGVGVGGREGGRCHAAGMRKGNFPRGTRE